MLVRDACRSALSPEAMRERLSSPARVTPVVEVLDPPAPPLDAYLRLKRHGRSFLFESADLGGKAARFSFIGAGGDAILVKDGAVLVNGTRMPAREGPVAFLKDLLAGFEPADPVFTAGEAPLPVFHGGLAGYIAYDFVRYIADIGDTARDDIGCPDAELAFVEDLAVYDHRLHKLLLIANDLSGDVDGAKARIARMRRSLATPMTASPPPAEGLKLEPAYSTSREGYMAMVARAREYILDGDAFQIVLSLRAEVEADVDPVMLYQALKEINPSPYMYFLEFGDSAIVGSSPEILVKVEAGKVTVRPIAGTRRRGKTEAEDRALEEEMKSDPKERAEHVMLVDLGRNDVGKVARFGTVRVDDFMGVEKYSHVQHIVSNVVGDLQEGRDAIDVLVAAFPAGTVSGAPKTRAMQIIEELEGRRRGLYAGCVGYFGFNANADLAIAIRTVLLRGGKAYVQAGAGIVLDSVPENEHAESMNKGAAMLGALGRAIRPA